MRGSIPAATIARLPLYLRCLAQMELGQTTCSSDELALSAGVNSAQVRKDLSFIDPPGVRGVGYHAAALRELLRKELGLTHSYKVVIAGAGNLGSALTVYPGFAESGFDVVALFDIDPAKAGTTISAIAVRPLSELESVVAAEGITIGIIATPADAAQGVADRFVAAGVRSILNFAPAVLKRPAGVEVRRVDLSSELQILSYHLSQADS
ncbi:MAG: redox-sensing transcriptional repressor Rex [Acidimicrobiia bacterium]|nr:redox-sensing transcriptional repressor Rex [Acidimicrobiia bacterium]MDX2466053.1 redox-sensing transcriptional repressor Rex [Acidimicrobiia bacterium]